LRKEKRRLYIVKNKYNPEDFDYKEILKNIRIGMVEQREEYREAQTDPDITETDLLDIVRKVSDPLENLFDSFPYSNTEIEIFRLIEGYVSGSIDDLDLCMEEIMRNLMNGIDISMKPLKKRVDLLENSRSEIERMLNVLISKREEKYV
jgi:hypothetical protein